AECETDFCVLASVERALPATNRLERLAPNEEVERRPIVDRANGPDWAEPSSEASATKERLVERAARTLAKRTPGRRQSWTADRRDRRVPKAVERPIKPVARWKGVVVEEGQYLASRDGLRRVALLRGACGGW